MSAASPVYLVVTLQVKDLQDFLQRYGMGVIAQIQQAGAELLAVGAPTFLEGNPDANRGVVIRFPSAAALRAWYESPAYAPFKRLRCEELTTDGTAFVLEAFDPAAFAAAAPPA